MRPRWMVQTMWSHRKHFFFVTSKCVYNRLDKHVACFVDIHVYHVYIYIQYTYIYIYTYMYNIE